MNVREIVAKQESDTAALGKRLSKLLFPGAFIALTGELGAGKTAFSKGVGEGLGADDVTSPTFTIVEEHDTEPRLYHFDVYRLAGEDELYAMGYEDYLNAGGVILMEWANLVPAALPNERLDIEIGVENGERIFRFTPRGIVYEGLVSKL